MATDLVEVDEWTAAVTVPEDGDDYDAASVELPLQALTNRTVRLNSRVDAVPDQPYTWSAPQAFEDALGLAGPDNELTYQPLPRTRTMLLDQTSARPKLGANIALGDSGLGSPFGWLCNASSTLIYGCRLPHGSTLQRVRVGIYNGQSRDVTVHAYQFVAAVIGIAMGSSGATDLGATTDNIATTGVVAHDVPAPIVTNGAWHTYCVEVSLVTGQICTWCEVMFTDPGPRNF
jgi:hypothetical protein